MTKAALLIVTVVALVGAFAEGAPAVAQSEVDVRSSDARSEFPDGIIFTLDAAADAPIDEVRLVYEVAPDGVRAEAEPDCTGGTVVGCTFNLSASRRNLLIPGAEVTYFWRITVDGSTEETAPQRVSYDDSRFDWEQISEGNLTLWWYSGSEEEARRVLEAGRESLDGIGRLTETDVDFPVRIFYYASASDMQAAIISDSAGGVVTLGEVVYSNTAMVSADTAAEEIARHEVSHIVVREAVRGPFGVPDWLNEGTAVFAQSQPLSDQERALEAAIDSGQIISVRSLSSSSSGALGSRVSLFYGQSWSLVAFLVDEFGKEKFAELFQTFKDGAGTADALEQVYGFNQDGLENAWRESVGLPPREAPTPDPDAESRPAPTDAPAEEPEEQGAAQDDGDDSGVSAGVIVAIVILAALLAAGMLVAGVLLARRYR